MNSDRLPSFAVHHAVEARTGTRTVVRRSTSLERQTFDAPTLFAFSQTSQRNQTKAEIRNFPTKNQITDH